MGFFSGPKSDRLGVGVEQGLMRLDTFASKLDSLYFGGYTAEVLWEKRGKNRDRAKRDQSIVSQNGPGMAIVNAVQKAIARVLAHPKS